MVFALNNTVSSTTGYSTNFIVFGKQTMLPTDASLNLSNQKVFQNEKEMIVHLINERQNVQSIASDNLLKAHRSMKLRHDKQINFTTNFNVGDIAYLHIPSLLVKSTNKKLQPTYSGPYMITELPSKHTAKLRRLSDGVVTKKSISLDRLRKPPKSTAKSAIFNRLEKPGKAGKLLDPDIVGSTKLTTKDIPIIKKRNKMLYRQRKSKRM